MISQAQERMLLAIIRESINAAVRGGVSIGMIRSVCNDQLSGIEHFGQGDVDTMQREITRIDTEIRKAQS